MTVAFPHPLGRTVLPALACLLAWGLPVHAAGTAAEQGTVRGCVEVAGHTGYRGVASLWPAASGKAPDPRVAIRPPLVSGPLDNNGCFTLRAAPGDYFVGAVLRLTEGGWQGPPRPGDRVFLSPDADGKALTVPLRDGEALDIGRHDSGWTYAGFTSHNKLTVKGRLVNSEGNAVAGLPVFAFTDSSMSGEPIAVSEPSDAEGYYEIRLPEPATVYLRAREHYGRRNPLDGGAMGVCGGTVPRPVAVQPNGEEQSCNLTILSIPAAGARPEDNTRKRRNKEKP